MKKEQAAFQQYCANNSISKKALTIRNLKIKYDTYEHILSYNISRGSAYRKKNKIPRDQRNIPLLREKGTPEYYNFIKPDELNNPLSLVSGGSYNYLLNRILFSECIMPDANYIYAMFDDTLKARSIILSNEEQSFLNKLKECKDRDSLKILMKSDTAISNPFFLHYSSILTSVRSNAYYNYKNKKLAEYFGITEGFVKDIATSQSKCGTLKASLKPFSESNLNDIKENIHNEFIRNYLFQLSKAKEEEIDKIQKENKTKTGYSINETPKTEGDKVFDAIIQKYKGNVILVDFWATWCGPCRAGMEKMKPLKDEYKDKNIVFLYITDETSPVDTWNMMVPDIKGEHYRVNPDEWNFLKSRFSISGIPHYALVNKEGQIVKDKIYFASTSDEFRNLLNEYIK
jgi:thiol-disulfide isomerase/thioredoxin